MDSPIIAIGKVEATRQDNSYGGYQWSYRASCPFLSAISRQVQAGGLSLALWLDEKVLKGSPAQNPSSRHIQYFCGLEAFSISAPCASLELVHFRHRIGEKVVELILKESIRINLSLEDRKKEEEDRKNRKNGRGRKSDKDQTAFIDSSVQEKNVTFSATLRRRGRGRNNCTSILKV